MSANLLTLLGASILTVVLAAGAWLSWPRQPPRETHEQLGRPLLIGAIIGLAFLPLQLAIQRELKGGEERAADRARRDDDRRALLLQLTVRQRLAGIDLRYADLAGLYLRAKDLRYARLDDADLRGAVLDRANFARATANRARFGLAHLSHADFRFTELDGASFVRADLTDADFSRTPARSTEGGARSAGAGQVSPKAVIDYSYANLAGADFSGRSHQAESLFTGADLSSAKLTRADFHSVDLRRATLVGTDARQTFFCGSDMRGALIGGGSMRGAQFAYADLRGARFQAGTDFKGANFRRADLRGSRVVSTLTRPDGTAISSVEGMDSSRMFEGAYFDARTKGSMMLKIRGARPRQQGWLCSRTTPEGFDTLSTGHEQPG